jgi:signal transduction histidine kinase
MGLGLSLVSIILNSYHGHITVEDKVKGDYTQGSNFIVYIPEAP